jgi:hypothetical protein
VLPNAIKAFGVGNTVVVDESVPPNPNEVDCARTDKFDPTYSIKWLMKPMKTYSSMCHPENDIFLQNKLTPAQSSPFLIESDLGIEKLLMGAMLTEGLLPSQPPEQPAKSKSKSKTGGAKAAASGGGGANLGPFSVSIEMKFVIISNGNLTPTWKLVNISANTGSSPLFSTGRTRTHDLIITVGPDNADTRSAAYSLVLGNAVANGVRAGTTPAP